MAGAHGNGDWMPTLLAMLAEIRQENKDFKVFLARQEARHAEMDKRFAEMDKRVVELEEWRKREARSMKQVARILDGVALAIRQFDDRIGKLERRRP
ncbi:MAG: hypothetical protein HYZ53_17595 [Planctomycetes bacterium]|nr:hypothetical protein [Planctomycetota bacterium]